MKQSRYDVVRCYREQEAPALGTRRHHHLISLALLEEVLTEPQRLLNLVEVGRPNEPYDPQQDHTLKEEGERRGAYQSMYRQPKLKDHKRGVGVGGSPNLH